MATAPAEVIRRYLDENGGREEVEVEALIITWQLEHWTEAEQQVVSDALAQAGVFVSPELSGLAPTDRIVVHTASEPAANLEDDPEPAYVPSGDFFVSYSKDQDAVRDLSHWQDRRHELPIWKRKERREADEMADAAHRRCVDAGVDWSALPQPPHELHVPDRSEAKRIGRPAAAFASSIWRFLRTSPEPVHSGPDGSWFEAADGSLWLQYASGEVFGLREGTWLALDPSGHVWASNGEGLVTWSPDGTMVRLEEDGSLTAVDAEGNVMTLAENGSFYLESADGSFYVKREVLGPEALRDGQRWRRVPPITEDVQVTEAGRDRRPLLSTR